MAHFIQNSAKQKWEDIKRITPNKNITSHDQSKNNENVTTKDLQENETKLHKSKGN